jgi:hypothetical protein
MNAKARRAARRILHRNGVVAVEENFSGQKLHGRRRTWHRNGRLATEEFYRDGRLDGLCRQWNENGRLLGSFRVENGTGVQRSWHDNGRLNQEFTTVEGEFCGRSRLWLRDGTLISDHVELFGRSVTPEQYRRAAAKNPRLPKLRARPAKVPARNRAMEKHMQHVFVLGLLAKRNRSEARAWLKADGKTARSLGRFKRAGAAVKFVEELYQAGAGKVIVSDIYRNKRGDQFADCLLAQLPKAAKQRKTIRAVCTQLRKGDLGAVLPDRDLGESHLYISMG